MSPIIDFLINKRKAGRLSEREKDALINEMEKEREMVLSIRRAAIRLAITACICLFVGFVVGSTIMIFDKVFGTHFIVDANKTTHLSPSSLQQVDTATPNRALESAPRPEAPLVLKDMGIDASLAPFIDTSSMIEVDGKLYPLPEDEPDTWVMR